MSEETVLKAEVGKQAKKPPMVAVMLIAAGVILLATNLLNFHLSFYLWPVFVIGPGLLMLWPAYKSTAEDQSSLSFLAVPGAMVLTVGGLLFLMNLTNHFESWAYAWTLIIASAAAGYAYMKRFDPDGRAADKAHRFIRTMILFFMALAAFFEILVFQSLGAWWPLLVIGLGFYLWIKKDKRSTENE